MMIARGDDGEGRQLLVLGLSMENLRRLVQGQPMKLTADSHPGIPEGWNLVIAYGATERELMQQMAGAIGPTTRVEVDPRL